MKYKSIILSSLAFVPFSQLTHAQDAQKVTINNSLTTALQQVDTDGEYLQLEKASDLMEVIAAALDKYILPPMLEKEQVPAGFSMAKIFDITGLSEITASSKSIKKHGDNYLTKSFIQTNGSRKGILSLLGKADQPWASTEYAPANTSLLLETHLDLTALPQILKQLAPLLEKKDMAELLQGMKEKDPIAGKTVEELIAQASIRISIIAELDKTKTWKSQDIDLPVVHATGRIDGIAKFVWENYGPTISQMLPVESKGNVHTIVSPQKVDSPWGQLTPVIVIDTDKNHIWVSLSQEHLTACKDGKSKLTDNKDFQLVNQHNRKTGAARIYLSKEVLSMATDIIKKGIEQQVTDDDLEEILKKEMGDAFIKHLKSMASISSCVSHDDKGMHIHTHAPFPLKEVNPGFIYTSSALAGLAYGPIMKQIGAADNAEDISNLKSINTGLLSYYAENREFPDNIKQLVEAGEIEQEFLELNDRTLHYVKGLDVSQGNSIILYTSADKDGKLIIARVDGSVNAIFEDELEELLQQK